MNLTNQEEISSGIVNNVCLINDVGIGHIDSQNCQKCDKKDRIRASLVAKGCDFQKQNAYAIFKEQVNSSLTLNCLYAYDLTFQSLVILEQQEIAALIESSQQPTMITVLTLNVFIQVFLQGFDNKYCFSGSALQLIWSMMNDLSFIISLSMVSLQIPGIASPIQSILLSIIYMDLLMTDLWLKPILDQIITHDEENDNTAVNNFLDAQGFKSKLLIFNLGSTLIFLAMLVLLLIITGIAFQLRSVSRVQGNYQYNILVQ
ncbi:hypothetical protein FGO68_gene10213 [Halteria grandinella]|uniref:Transmembrane protein n=1 Tax=Halteria grandinella TaxID=5974 RepID=A0A8J8P311_HALGN|nr:hypothetical protein FGO68_gene10213 [Halteria grandinella]